MFLFLIGTIFFPFFIKKISPSFENMISNNMSDGCYFDLCVDLQEKQTSKQISL